MRAHVKTHKCVELGELTLRKRPIAGGCGFEGGGATGLCFQVLDELAPFLSSVERFEPSNHGNPELPGSKLDFLLTSQVISPVKLSRLSHLLALHADKVQLSVLIDDGEQIEGLKKAAEVRRLNMLGGGGVKEG